MKTFTTEIIDAEDGSGDGILQFPEEFIKEQDWREGDTLNLQVIDGQLIIRNLDRIKREDLSNKTP